MTNNPADRKERFRVLLQQLNLTDNMVVQSFANAEIEKLVVEKNKKSWHFYFLLERVLPYEIFYRFSTQLRHVFHHIAQVDFSIRVMDTQISEKEVLDYWSYCVKELDGISPMLLSLLNGQVPKLKGNKLTIQARNDTEARTLKQKYGEIISTIYQNLGFPLMMIDSEIGQNESNEEYKKFIEG